MNRVRQANLTDNREDDIYNNKDVGVEWHGIHSWASNSQIVYEIARIASIGTNMYTGISRKICGVVKRKDKITKDAISANK